MQLHPVNHKNEQTICGKDEAQDNLMQAKQVYFITGEPLKQPSQRSRMNGIKRLTCKASTSNSYRIFFDYQSHVFTLLLFNISIYGIFFLEKF